MSKIESALAKARGRVVRLESVPGAKGMEIVPMQQRSGANREADAVAATTALARMEEPWLLDERALAERRIIHIGMADTEAALAFRELRTKILRVAHENCIIMVTSVAKNSESALVAANLAISFSLDDSKTAMLMDCNLEAPSIDRVIPGNGDYGITDYLRSDAVRLDQIIHPVGLPRFRVIPAGKSHDRMAEYFTLAKMRELLNELRSRYPDRYIVLNAPPIAESADTSVLVELADYVVLVVPYGSATGAQIADAAKKVGNKKLLGAVFSDMPTLPSGHRGLLGWLARIAGFASNSRRKSKKKK